MSPTGLPYIAFDLNKPITGGDMSIFSKIFILLNLTAQTLLAGDKPRMLSHAVVAIDDVKIHEVYSTRVEAVKGNAKLSAKEKKAAIKFLKQCLSSDFFRFYLVNGGLNGPLTEYMALYHKFYKKMTPWGTAVAPLEAWHFNQTFFVLAYQETQLHVSKFLEKEVNDRLSLGVNDVRFASVAGGTLYEFIQLSLTSEQRTKVSFHGFDLDQESLDIANRNAENHSCSVSLYKQDAWQPLADGNFDVITCNGFTFYIEDDVRLTELFSNFYQGLKEGGKIEASFILPMESWDATCTEKTSKKINAMFHAIEGKWTKFRSKDDMIKILVHAGFSQENIEFIDEDRAIHPIVTARR